VRQPSGFRRVDKIAPNSFAAVIRAYLASPKFQGLGKNTQYNYRRYLKIAEHPEVLGAFAVGVIRPAVVQEFLDGLADRPGIQQCARVAIKAVEKWALTRDLLPFPITTGTEIVGSDGGHKPWTDAQVAIAEAHSRPEVSRIITLAANTGQRGSDLCRMRWSDIEKVEGRPGINVVQTKTGLTLWIPFTEALQQAAETWERRPGFILTKADGTPWDNRKALYSAWTHDRDRRPMLAPCAGMVLHGLRATAIVRLRRAGAPPTLIADMVGLSVPMIERYCRFADQKQSAMAAVHYLDRTGSERARPSILEGRTKTTK
jgi:integrase